MSEMFDGVAIPPAGNGVVFMERNDSDVFAFVFLGLSPPARGVRFSPSGKATSLSGVAALDCLNPYSWSPMTRAEFVAALRKIDSQSGN